MFEQKDIVDVKTSNGDWENDKTEDIVFVWGIKNFGFGETVFYYEDGKLKCENETMSKEMIKTILCEFIDRAEFQS